MAMADPGYYKGRVKSWDLVKKNDKFQIILYCGLTHFNPADPDPEKMVELERPLKRTIFYHISPNNRGMILSELQALGYSAKTLDAKVIKPGNEESFDFSAADGVFELEHDAYPEKVKGVETGKMKETERIRVCRRKASEPLPAEDVDQFNQLYGQEEDLKGF